MQQRCSCAQNVKQGLVYKLEECSIHSTWLNKEKTLCREPIDNMDRRRLLPPVALVRDPPPFTVNEQVLVYGIAETPVAGRICEDMEFRRKGTYSVELNDDRSVVHDISGTSMISADQGYLTPRSSCNFVRTVMDGIHPANPSDLLLHPPAEPIPKVQALKMMEQYSKLIYLKCESASNRATFHVRRSVLYMAFNQINDALKDAQRAIELDSTYVVAYFRQGIALYCLGKYPKAVQSFRKGLALDPHSPQLRHALDRTLALHRSESAAAVLQPARGS